LVSRERKRTPKDQEIRKISLFASLGGRERIGRRWEGGKTKETEKKEQS